MTDTQGRYLGVPVPVGLPAGAPSGPETISRCSFILRGMGLAEEKGASRVSQKNETEKALLWHLLKTQDSFHMGCDTRDGLYLRT